MIFNFYISVTEFLLCCHSHLNPVVIVNICLKVISQTFVSNKFHLCSWGWRQPCQECTDTGSKDLL